MGLKQCNFCTNEVPTQGQCNQCGFIDGINRPPTDHEFRHARLINQKYEYSQFRNIDMLLLD